MLKRLMAIILAFAVIAMPTAAFAAESQRIDWFVKPGKDGSQPILLDGSELPEKYGAITVGPEDDKTVYLTFDAGYANENTEKILDILYANGISATFFILPGIIKNDLPLVLRMVEEGHTVGNHSYTHSDMSKISDIKAFKKELTDLEKLFYERTDTEMSKYFRPSEGAFSENTLKFANELGYRTVFWSFAYPDWDNGKQPDPDATLKKILSQVHNGMVLLLHPNSSTNAAILQPLITELKAMGYSFGTLDELCQKLGYTAG